MGVGIVHRKLSTVLDRQRVSQKPNIYSFGIVLLELVTGKDPICASLNDEEGVDLPRWVRSVASQEWTSEVLDLELLRCEYHEDMMLSFLELAFSCTTEDPDMRPSISEVVLMIKELY
ncbi:hypothetical protein GIB67_006138 [Kingdonia uniflora]|uniref:Protein kinase domain-containing protein n=1 Tax=Kingdonia uniflora TaxID=39325 RepID=A0A7J7LPQ0_9MAGN|nr:hypothetical protein GIB67_006138 [Kingdonia uniflora]